MSNITLMPEYKQLMWLVWLASATAPGRVNSLKTMTERKMFEFWLLEETKRHENKNR